MAIYNIHAGHNFIVPGASGCFSETSEARQVKNKVINLLRSQGHTVYDCTDEDGRTSSQNLANIVSKCNSHAVDLDVSIHFNAFNGQAHGVEVYQYDGQTSAISQRICSKINGLGFYNRGVKPGQHLYVINSTNSKAILIECCFCDNAGDASKYTSDKMAKAIVEAILNKTVSGGTSSGGSTNKPTTDKLYRVRKSWSDAKSQLGAYANLDNAKKNCPAGYTVYDWNGKAVYGAGTAPSVDPNTKLYRVRKSWSDAKSQIGAYKSLDNAKSACPKGYNVYDWNGKAVYSNGGADDNANTEDKLYRVRKSWDDEKSQTGAYKSLDNAKANCGVGYTVYDWNGKAVYTNNGTKPEEPDTKPDEKPDTKPEAPEAVDISPLKDVDHDTFIEYVGTIAKEDMRKTGVLASVTIAQAILESAWGQSELSLKANNLFGMKASLSGNNWDSEWDGKIYAKRSPEENEDGTIEQILSDFRAYDHPKKSIKDHSDYLRGAKNGNKLRYEGLVGERDYKKAIQIIKDGGYATDSGYVDKIVRIIEENHLDVWDYSFSPSDIEEIKDEIGEIIDIVKESNGIIKTILKVVNSIFDFLKSVFTKK